MFSKLGQRSTSWWICVTITSIFATILVTVVAYPTYAALCAGNMYGGLYVWSFAFLYLL